MSIERFDELGSILLWNDLLESAFVAGVVRRRVSIQEGKIVWGHIPPEDGPRDWKTSSD
jgi:hypothetical protein